MAPLLNEEESGIDPYDTLGLESGAAEGDIKKAYRKLSLKYHPDKNPTPEGAVMFRKISVALAILTDTAKRSYIDTRLESDRKKAARYAEAKGKQKEMLDALLKREEEARLAKVNLAKRKRDEAEAEGIMEAGRKMVEEAQKRAAEATRAKEMADNAKQRHNGMNGTNHSNGTGTTGTADGDSRMPEISPTDLSLILTVPSSVSTDNLESRITAAYGSVAHYILKPPVQVEGKKSKSKPSKAVVEFKKGNWGGCWACWKDHQRDSSGSGLGEGVRAKWVTGETPKWVEWAEKQSTIPSTQKDNSSARSNVKSASAGVDSSHPFANLTATPTFTTAPDFGSTTMADLLNSHDQSRKAQDEAKRKMDEFESMTLFQMRQRERQRLEAEIRAQEGDE